MKLLHAILDGIKNSLSCRSPNHYAQQRTMVVMETVRAATLASQRRKERLTAELSSLPLAASSPGARGNKKSGMVSSIDVCPPSPILSANSGSLPDELIRYRNQTYVAPEKLQIVKPLEGSVTLLKWKLLASPQLGGATSFFSDAAQPGVHRKKWKAGGVIDEGRLSLSGTKIKSLSTTDISLLEHSPSHSYLSQPSRKKHDTVSLGLSVSMDGANTHRRVSAFKAAGEANGKSSNSVLSQVGTFLGSGLSHIGFGSGKNYSPVKNHVSIQQEKESAGLSTLLDS